ncbi:MAG: BrnA antitoxin family protein [Rhodobacter sp.]|nr:BrnA antitoxin family protein [Rhodobacter sp.]
MKEKNFTRISLEQARKLKDQSDWSALRDAGDHEGPREFEVDWSSAELVVPDTKKSVSLRLDPDVLDFFRSQGKGYQTRINAVLRTYMEAKKKAG